MRQPNAVRLLVPSTSRQWRRARKLIDAYATSLNVDLSFQGFEHELEHLATAYGPPDGAFLLAELNGDSLGCVGLRRFSNDTGEIKRLFVTPAGRGQGIGRLLAEGIIAEARRLAYSRLVLDTLPSMAAARALYASLGFVPIDAYRFNPVPGTAFLELTLNTRSSGRPRLEARRSPS